MAKEMQFSMINILYLYINSLQSTHSVPNVAVFLVLRCPAFPANNADILWMILKSFHFPLLLLVSVSFLRSTYAAFVLKGLRDIIIIIIIIIIIL